ncbi:MAG: disulfide bond formation protein B [Gammaproteobacteria bacterium]|nr:disulfide bond formation protein B [Gammaproteobacteria bacterium]
MSNNPTHSQSWTWLFTAWLIAAVATLASLFFSEVMKLTPCVLCWYQRIFMFPLAIILLIGLMPLDTRVVRYALPLTLLGLFFTVYHLLLFYGFIPENLRPCDKTLSCADASMVLFNVVPIPLLSLAAFSAIAVLLLKIRKHP